METCSSLLFSFWSGIVGDLCFIWSDKGNLVDFRSCEEIINLFVKLFYLLRPVIGAQCCFVYGVNAC